MDTTANKLKKQRELRGWSQRRLGELIDTDKVTICRWETGKTKPSPYYREALCKVFETTADKLGLLDDTPQIGTFIPFYQASKQSIISTEGYVLDMQRRQFLDNLLKTACASLILSPFEVARILQMNVNGEALDSLETITQHYWKICTNASVDLFGGVIGLFQSVTQLLNQPHTETTSKRLHTLAGELAQILGEMLFEIHEYSLARAYQSFSIQAATTAGNDTLKATALARLGLLAIYTGQPKTGISYLEEGQRLATHDARVSSWLHCIQGETYAHIGQVNSCIQALETAETTMTKPLGEDKYRTGLNPSKLLGYKGACFIRLDKPDLALPPLQEALKLADVNAVSSHSVVIKVDIGKVYAQQGELEGAITYANQALDASLQIRSLHVLDRIYTLRPLLDTWKDEPAVKTLDEQIRDVHTQIIAQGPVITA